MPVDPQIVTVLITEAGPWVIGVIAVMMTLQVGGLGLFSWVVHKELVLLRQSIDSINERLLDLLGDALHSKENKAAK